MRSNDALKLKSTKDAEPVIGQGRLARSAERIPVNLRASLSYMDSFRPVVLTNISAHGAGIEGCGSMMPRDKVIIKFVDGRTITAQVRWWLAGRCGILFDTPLQTDDLLLSQTIRQRPTEALGQM